MAAAANPRRVLAPTACSEAGEAPRPVAIFKPLHGYSTADVLQDRRFRARPEPDAVPLHSLRCIGPQRARSAALPEMWRAGRQSWCFHCQRDMIVMCWHMQSRCACSPFLLAGAADVPDLLGHALSGLLQVLEALQQLGMHRSPYARRLVQHAAPATAPRSDALCTA